MTSIICGIIISAFVYFFFITNYGKRLLLRMHKGNTFGYALGGCLFPFLFMIMIALFVYMIIPIFDRKDSHKSATMPRIERTRYGEDVIKLSRRLISLFDGKKGLTSFVDSLSYKVAETNNFGKYCQVIYEDDENLWLSIVWHGNKKDKVVLLYMAKDGIFEYDGYSRRNELSIQFWDGQVNDGGAILFGSCRQIGKFEYN